MAKRKYTGKALENYRAREDARKQLLNRYDLPDAFCRVLNKYMGFMNPEYANIAWVSHGEVAKQVKKSPRTVRAYLKAAEIIGAIQVLHTSVKDALEALPELRGVIKLPAGQTDQKLIVATFKPAWIGFQRGRQPMPLEQIAIVTEEQRRTSAEQKSRPVVKQLPEAVERDNGPVVDDRNGPVVDDRNGPVVDDRQKRRERNTRERNAPPLLSKGGANPPAEPVSDEPIAADPGMPGKAKSATAAVPVFEDQGQANTASHKCEATEEQSPMQVYTALNEYWAKEESTAPSRWEIQDLRVIAELGNLKVVYDPALLRDLNSLFPRSRVRPEDLAAATNSENWAIKKRRLPVFLAGECRDDFIREVNNLASIRRTWTAAMQPVSIFQRCWASPVDWNILELENKMEIQEGIPKDISMLYLNRHGLQGVTLHREGYYLSVTLPPLTPELQTELYPAWQKMIRSGLRTDCDRRALRAEYHRQEPANDSLPAEFLAALENVPCPPTRTERLAQLPAETRRKLQTTREYERELNRRSRMARLESCSTT